jgi:hypothetical protein
LHYNTEDYEAMMENLEKLKEKESAEDNSALVKKLIDERLS